MYSPKPDENENNENNDPNSEEVTTKLEETIVADIQNLEGGNNTTPQKDTPVIANQNSDGGQMKLINQVDYLTLMQIGSGNFSELYLVEEKNSKILYVLKMFTKMRVEQLKKQTDVLMEKHVMKKISDHKNIIKCFGSNKDNIFLYILYEYVNGGELWKKCMHYGLPSTKLIKFYFLQILDGISHMHKFNIVHRDIKPENIMITKNEMTIKIIDFGSCKDMEGTEFEKNFEKERVKQKVVRPSFRNFVGTPNYMAPECVRNKNSDFSSDMWSLGCVLFHLFTGFAPFLGKSDYLIFQKSIEANYKFPEDVVPSDAANLISKLIVVDPKKRLSMEEVYNHPFIAEENKNEKFRMKYPIFDLKDYAFMKIQKSLRQKFYEFNEMSFKIDKIKNYEQSEEDCKKHEIPEDEEINPSVKEAKKLLCDKSVLIEKYQLGLQNFKNEMEEIRNKVKENGVQNSKEIANKFNLLEKQILHEIFRVDYEETSALN